LERVVGEWELRQPEVLGSENVHQNAHTTPWSRAEIVRRVAELGQSVATVAATFHVTHKTASRWVERAKAAGGLQERSCRPHSSPAATPPELLDQIERLRRQRWPFDRAGRHSQDRRAVSKVASVYTGIMVMLTATVAALPTPARESKDGPR